MHITFCYTFALKGLASAVPPGTYRIDIEEEPIEAVAHGEIFFSCQWCVAIPRTAQLAIVAAVDAVTKQRP